MSNVKVALTIVLLSFTTHVLGGVIVLQGDGWVNSLLTNRKTKLCKKLFCGNLKNNSCNKKKTSVYYKQNL